MSEILQRGYLNIGNLVLRVIPDAFSKRRFVSPTQKLWYLPSSAKAAAKCAPVRRCQHGRTSLARPLQLPASTCPAEELSRIVLRKSYL